MSLSAGHEECVCVCVCACVRACVRVCVCVGGGGGGSVMYISEVHAAERTGECEVVQPAGCTSPQWDGDQGPYAWGRWWHWKKSAMTTRACGRRTGLMESLAIGIWGFPPNTRMDPIPSDEISPHPMAFGSCIPHHKAATPKVGRLLDTDRCESLTP